MKAYKDPCDRDYQIRDKHYLEQELTMIKLRDDLKTKTRRLYIAGFIIFVLMFLAYLYIQTNP